VNSVLVFLAVLTVQPQLLFNQHLYFGSFSRPKALAIDKTRGEIWVADAGDGVIGIYKPNGVELFAFTSKQYLRDPVRMAVAPNGDIAVLEGDRKSIRLFNYRGDYKRDLVLEGIGDKPLVGAIAWDAGGKLYVGDNRSCQVFIYEADGKLRQQFGSRGSDEGQFETITAITIGPDGSIYIADAQALAVQIFDNQGNFVRGWGRHETGAENFSLPSGIALDSQGRIYVSDELRHQIKIFDPRGQFLIQFGGLGEGRGQLAFPTDVAVDSEDRVYVAERTNVRVQVFGVVAN